MNKKIKNILIWLKDVWLKTLAVFLFLGLGFYAYAAVSWPTSDPNPTTGVVGVFVGKSSSAYSASVGYQSANQYCSNAFTKSHICTAMEIQNSYNHVAPGSAIMSYNGAPLWVNNGPPGYVKYVTNDCSGWKSKVSTIFGSVWDFSQDASYVTPCNKTRYFACCK